MGPTKSVEEIYGGLSSSEAAELLKEHGPNELPSQKKNSLLNIIVETTREPTFILLLLGSLFYIFIGDLAEAALMFAFVLLVIGLSIYQELKVERALEALRDLSSPRARVIRDGKQVVIPGRDIVPGDIVILSEGDRVPSDMVILSCRNLSVDESLLTGESSPVGKTTWDGKSKFPRPGGDGLPCLYSSTLVSQGHGIARVVSIGEETEVGKIGVALSRIEPEKTELQKETDRLVKIYSTIGGATCVLVLLFLGLIHKNWAEGFVAGLSLAMALVPYEFIVVLAGFLALGAWRMSRHNVLTRRMGAIPNLGSSTVLCSDKTGTLTLNKMTLQTVWANGKTTRISDDHLPGWSHETLEYATLASQSDPYDPMERAIKEASIQKLSGTEHVHADWELVKEYPLSKTLLALSHVWRSPRGEKYLIAAKGAPEAVFDLCHLPKTKEKRLMAEVSTLSDQGLRVLGVARAYFSPKKLPESQHEFEFDFVGLVGLDDPVRPEVPEAVKECYEAGMRVIMITGDYPGTARTVAKKSGFANYGDIITGEELDSLSDNELRQRIRKVSIFARVVPEQKLRIVNALKDNGEVVVMTGDGVNDAPALKAASIGVAMGNRGTEVAREASSLVLTDDNFASIVRAVRMGRRVYDNIKKAMGYIISVHVPIAGISLLPVVLGWPIVLYPVHVAFLELIIDPVCSVVFEAEKEEKNIMKRKPRKANERMFTFRAIWGNFIRGASIFLATATVYYISIHNNEGEGASRAAAFATLVFCNLALILSSRSSTKSIAETFKEENKALWVVFCATLFFLFMVVYASPLQTLFRLQGLGIYELAGCALAAMASIIPSEIAKIFNRKEHRPTISQ